MQPMIFIDAGQVPTRLGVIAAGRAWHYRPELARLASAATILGSGLWLHLACPHRLHLWLCLIADVAMAAPAVGTFGACAWPARLAELVYLATAALAADGWLAVACAPGSFTAPLPQVLGIGMPIFGAPWRGTPVPARAARPWRR
jgi:hypothetical protein